jgi:hypothetical protein
MTMNAGVTLLISAIIALLGSMQPSSNCSLPQPALSKLTEFWSDYGKAANHCVLEITSAPRPAVGEHLRHRETHQWLSFD